MKKIIIIVVIAALLATGGTLYYFYYQGEHYFRTENASVAADTISISPLMTGALSSWNVREGDDVRAGQALGRQDVSTLVQSSAMSAQSLGSSADAVQSKAEIRSPINGKVMQSSVVEGQTVSPGTQVAVVADTANLYIKANVEETSIFKIKQGQEVDVTIDAYPGKAFKGFVESVGMATQNAFSLMPSLTTSGTFSKTTQLIPVRIGIVNPEGLPFLLGMNATVSIHLK